MKQSWLAFQGSAGEDFSRLIQILPGSLEVKLCIFSAILGVVLIYLYQFVSFQNKLVQLKKRIMTIILEPFLFRDTFRLSLLVPLNLVGLGLKYLLLSLPPLLILAAPVVWLLGLWNQVIGYTVVGVGEQAEVIISAESPKEIRKLQLSVMGNGYTLSPAVRSYQNSVAYYGLQKVSPAADGTLAVTVGSSTATLALEHSPTVSVFTTNPLERLLFPGNKVVLPDGIKEISIRYPDRHFAFAGVHLPWTVAFLLISMASGLIFAKLFRIQV